MGQAYTFIEVHDIINNCVKQKDRVGMGVLADIIIEDADNYNDLEIDTIIESIEHNIQNL